MIGISSRITRFSSILGLLLVFGTAVAEAADQVAVWEVVTTYRRYLDNNGRLKLMSDGTTDKGYPWIPNGTKVEFGREGKEGSAKLRAGGTYYRGRWIGGWNLHARVLMNNTTLKTENAAPAVMPEYAGESLIGTKPSTALKNSIVDLWEFNAVMPGTNKFIQLTCEFTPDNLVLDGNQKIGTYEVQKKTVVVKFVDPQFGRITFVEKQDNALTGKTKPVKRKFWNLKFGRVQRQAVYRTVDNKNFILYTNNRVQSPRYTSDYYTTFYWYFNINGGKRQLLLRSIEAKVTADGRRLFWNNKKMTLIAGRHPQ